MGGTEDESRPKPLGLIEGVSFEDYCKLPGINWSKAKQREHSAAMVQWHMENDSPDSVGRAQGRAFHSLTLEPDTFLGEFAVYCGSGSRSTKAYKAWAGSPEQQDKTLLKASEFGSCFDMAQAAYTHELSAPYLRGGVPESTLVWTDSETGLLCKARPDYIIETSPTSGIVVDLKSMTDIRERVAGSQIAKQQWHGQSAFYAGGLSEVLGWTDIKCVIIGVEIKCFHDVGLFDLGTWRKGTADIDFIDAGQVLVREYLEQIAEDRRLGVFPGRYSFEIPLQPPNWAAPDHFTIFQEGDNG